MGSVGADCSAFRLVAYRISAENSRAFINSKKYKLNASMACSSTQLLACFTQVEILILKDSDHAPPLSESSEASGHAHTNTILLSFYLVLFKIDDESAGNKAIL